MHNECRIALGWLLIVTVLVIARPMVIQAQEKRLQQPMTQQASSFPQAKVVLSYAGSLNAVISEDIGPGFTTATKFPLTNISGPSVELANQIRSRKIEPDVFMSADAEVNQVLMGRESGEVGRATCKRDRGDQHGGGDHRDAATLRRWLLMRGAGIGARQRVALEPWLQHHDEPGAGDRCRGHHEQARKP